jgi:hypothetical protein
VIRRIQAVAATRKAATRRGDRRRPWRGGRRRSGRAPAAGRGLAAYLLLPRPQAASVVFQLEAALLMNQVGPFGPTGSKSPEVAQDVVRRGEDDHEWAVTDEIVQSELDQ